MQPPHLKLDKLHCISFLFLGLDLHFKYGLFSEYRKVIALPQPGSDLRGPVCEK